MILITGAAGFIGSCLISRLNALGYKNLLLVDQFSDSQKLKNLSGKSFLKETDRLQFISEIRKNKEFPIEFVFHLGARTDTTEQDEKIFNELNLEFSKSLWIYCSKHSIPFVYASSAATYGDGELGYLDDHTIVNDLRPLNPYGKSKNDFDKWVLRQNTAPPLWAGLKFFNVYGPNEYHKGRMASVVFHTYQQIRSTGKMRLFRSHKPEIKDGHQSRDFIYVKDVVQICMGFMVRPHLPSGIYNVGTGTARTFLDLARLTFRAMGKEPHIEFIDTPKDIRATYQYYTRAEIGKLLDSGYKGGFNSLERGITDYVKNYLARNEYM